MNNKKKLLLYAICITLIAAVSACHYPRVHVKIAIISHENEQSVVLNQETRIRSLATASRGVESVALFINNELVDTDTPPEGNPIEYTADQPWTPKSEGHATISVVTTDVEGRTSDPVSITLQVVPAISETNGTPTPTVTVTPLGLDQTQTAEAICTNAATFVEHVTIPINANLTPESNFTKIWRVNNSAVINCGVFPSVNIGLTVPNLVTHPVDGTLAVSNRVPGAGCFFAGRVGAKGRRAVGQR